MFDQELADIENERWLEKRPVCAECGMHIQDEYGFHIGNEWYHEECARSVFMEEVVDE